MVQSTPLNTETLPLNFHLTMTYAFSGNSWMPQQHSFLQPREEMIVTITCPSVDQEMEPFQHRPAIGFMNKH